MIHSVKDFVDKKMNNKLICFNNVSDDYLFFYKIKKQVADDYETRKSKRLTEKNYRAFKELLKIIKHYFPNFNKLLSSVSDPRHKSYITYTQEEILFFRILIYCYHFKSMREITRELNNDHGIQTSRLLFGDELEEVPHGDTINSYLEEVSIDQLRYILREMLRELMKKNFLMDLK